MSDSVSLVFAGQVRSWDGKDAFQEANIVGLPCPLQNTIETLNILNIVQEAVHIAATGRQVGFVIDLPRYQP